MKKILSVILVVIMLLSFAGCGEKNYEEITATELEQIRKLYHENKAKAEDIYIGKYVCIEIDVGNIPSKDSFSGTFYDTYIHWYNDKIFYVPNHINCSTKNYNLQKTILNLKNDESVIVRGKITGISVSWDYVNVGFPDGTAAIFPVTIDMKVYEIITY